MTEDRRKDPRVAMDLRAEVKFTSWLVYSVLYMVNISKGGMNLELDEEPKLGASLEIRLTQPDGSPVLLQAVVKHATQHESRWSVGVQFENLDDNTREAIEHKIRAHGAVITPARNK